MYFIDEQRNADMLDALADIAYEQEQAMRESEQSEWLLVDCTDAIINADLINEHVSNDHQREH
jgi:ribosomal silencing factor RsfS